MRITIDKAGRLVIPRAIRDELGIRGPTELEILARDGTIEMAVADAAARVEHLGSHPVIVADPPMAPLDVEGVRAAIDRVRR